MERAGASSDGGGVGVSPEGEERFNDAYEKALLRKRLFKEYLSRHQVLERFNLAIEALFECSELPQDPFPFLMDTLKTPLTASKPRPASATFRKMGGAPK
ncbi:hypothetical protein FOA52_009123 [Chlamydomonas sp. UWO 241]|nr:hypothetical protein FOA52_009123 [Chlamydomonas sp. UWO 241]